MFQNSIEYAKKQDAEDFLLLSEINFISQKMLITLP